MNEIIQASFAFDIPVLLPLLGAFTVLLASRKWRALKMILWVSITAYIYFTVFPILTSLASNTTWQAHLIVALVSVATALWIIVLPFFCLKSPRVYRSARSAILITLNAFIIILFWVLSGSLYFGYIDVPGLLPEPIRSLVFANGAPQWLDGPIFMWNSGTEAWPMTLFFLVFATAILFVYARTKKSLLLLILLPIILIFIPQLHTDWMALILFAIYPISQVYLGVTIIGYTLYGSCAKEPGFFGNMENTTGLIPPRK